MPEVDQRSAPEGQRTLVNIWHFCGFTLQIFNSLPKGSEQVNIVQMVQVEWLEKRERVRKHNISLIMYFPDDVLLFVSICMRIIF